MTKIDYKIQYDRWWSNYDELNHLDPGTRVRKEFIINYLKDTQIKTILDIGCGTGELLEYVHGLFPSKELYGTDVSQKALERLSKKNIAHKIYFLDLIKPSSIPGRFDVIVCSEVIEHLENQKNAYDFIAKKCKKGGVAIVTVPSGKIYPHHRKLGHYRHFEPNDVAQELEKRGFRILVAKKIGWPFMNLKNILITHILKDTDYSNNKISVLHQMGLKLFYYLYKYSLDGLGPQLFVVARKL